MSVLNVINSLNIVESEKKRPLLVFKDIGPVMYLLETLNSFIF